MQVQTLPAVMAPALPEVLDAPGFSASITVASDPFRPSWHEPARVITAPVPLAATEPATELPHILLRNGQPVLRAQWGELVQHGDAITWVCLPQSGDSSGILRLVALAVISYFTVGAGGAAMGLTATQGAVLMVAGTMLVNALIPPPKPNAADAASALATPSPTYNLQAQGNLARLEQAIPVQYGRLCVFPDLASLPYAEYAGNEQYLYQLMCIGYGEYEIEAVRIDDTPVTAFDEIAYEIIDPGGTITIFPGAVNTSAEVTGQEALGLLAGTYSQSGTTITVTLTGHGLSVGRSVLLDFTSGTAVDGEFTVATTPTGDTFTVTAGGALTTSGNVNVTRFLGGFIANTAGTDAVTLGLDFIASRGLYSYNTGTGAVTSMSVSVEVSYRTVDAAGAPTGSWVTVPKTFTDSTTTPQRYSFRQDVSAARYEVRVRRTDAKNTATTVGHELLWGGLRAYLRGSNSYAGVTLLAMRMRASNNLSNLSARKINVICTRKIPTWTGSAWTANTATRSIAWAAADLLRSSTGAALDDTRIDVAGLQALDAVWSARGDTFNGRWDRSVTLWEALQSILSAGRARPFLQGGVVRFARDQAATLPVALFSARNMVKGSLQISQIMPGTQTADCVTATYFDDVQWAPQRITEGVAGSAKLKPAKVDLFGVTDRLQARREAIYHAASNRYRRRTVRFATEMEGFIPSFGDLIAIAHDVPAWGQSFEVVATNTDGTQLTLDAAPTWGSGTHYVGLRNRDGSVDGPIVVVAGATSTQVTLATAPARVPYVGGNEERTHLVFGPGETWRQRARVTSCRPRDAEHVEIEAVCEDDNVHTAELGLVVDTPTSSQLTTLYTTPVVSGLVIRSSAADALKALLSWQAAAGAEYYVIEMAPNNLAGTAWTRVAESTATNYAVTVLYGVTTWIRVAGVGATRGPWASAYFGAASDFMWTTDSALFWSADANLQWKA